jgi:mycothiol synthase
VDGLELRVPAREDAGAIAELLNEQSLALTGRPDVTGGDVARWFDEPGLDPERDMRVAVGPDGVLVGYADLGGDDDNGPVWIYIRLRPGREGAGGPLLGEMERCASLRNAPPRTLRVFIHMDDHGTRAVLDGTGYRFVRSAFRMEIELAEEVAPPAWPDGLVARPLEPGEGPRAYEAYTAAFADTLDFYALPYEQWAFWLFDEADDPALAFLVDDGDDIAGLSISRERRGGDVELGWIHVIGVRPPWRRRGLGRALLLHALGELRARGKPRAGLGVDGASGNAVRLYESEGMRIVRRNDVYEKAP